MKAAVVDDDEAEHPPTDRKMTFSEHLDELRKHLVRGTVVVVLLIVVTLIFQDSIARFVMYPYEITKAKLASQGIELRKLSFVDVTEGFMFEFRTACYGALLIGMPYLIWELWRFVAVGLYPRERRLVTRVIPISIVLFLVGATLSYRYLLPLTLQILLAQGNDLGIEPSIRLDSYLGFFLLLCGLLGLIFQLPLIQVILARLGIVTAAKMASFRRMFILVAAILAAVLTPTGDAPTMTAVAAPMVVLYEIGILFARRIPPRKPPE